MQAGPSATKGRAPRWACVVAAAVWRARSRAVRSDRSPTASTNLRADDESRSNAGRQQVER